jgi:hypothetical protein
MAQRLATLEPSYRQWTRRAAGGRGGSGNVRSTQSRVKSCGLAAPLPTMSVAVRWRRLCSGTGEEWRWITYGAWAGVRAWYGRGGTGLPELQGDRAKGGIQRNLKGTHCIPTDHRPAAMENRITRCARPPALATHPPTPTLVARSARRGSSLKLADCPPPPPTQSPRRQWRTGSHAAELLLCHPSSAPRRHYPPALPTPTPVIGACCCSPLK